MRSYGKVIWTDDLILAIDNVQGWYFLFITRFRNYLFLESCLLINFYLEGNTLFDIFELDFTGKLRDDNTVIRIPLANNITIFYFLAVFHHQWRTIRNVIHTQCNSRLFVDQFGLWGTWNNNINFISFAVLAFNGLEIFNLDTTVKLNDQFVILRDVTSNTPNVERS